jgi:hypothetical protein
VEFYTRWGLQRGAPAASSNRQTELFSCLEVDH